MGLWVDVCVGGVSYPNFSFSGIPIQVTFGAVDIRLTVVPFQFVLLRCLNTRSFFQNRCVLFDLRHVLNKEKVN